MGELINLRRARKGRKRAAAETSAAANRVRHGRTRVERDGDVRDAERARRLLDGAKLDPSSPGDAVE